MMREFTDLEKSALRHLIRFAWSQHGREDYEGARRLVIDALELDDSRPVDREKRAAALNAFCDDAPTQS